MKHNVDVLVIGGGIIGVCAAHFLQKAGRQVTLIDRDDIGAGASFGNSGCISISHSDAFARPGSIPKKASVVFNPLSPVWIPPRLDFKFISWLLRFRKASKESEFLARIPLLRDWGRASLDLYREFAAHDNFDFGFQAQGSLTVFQDAHAFATASRLAESIAQHEVHAEILDGAEVRRREPSLRLQVIGGIFSKEDAHIDPAAFVVGMAQDLEAHEVRIEKKTEVLGLEISGRKVRTVRTTRGDFVAKDVVLATGSGSRDVLRSAQLPSVIEPVKGYSVTIVKPETASAHALVLNEAKVYLTPFKEFLRIGGTLEFSSDDMHLNEARIKAMVQNAKSYVTSLEKIDIVEMWRGLRPMTPDGLPIIGKAPTAENLYIATGHGMNGIKLGPITGKVVSEMVSGNTPSLDPTAFSPRRFH